MKKNKVLILQNELSSYNVDVYNLLAEKYELTLGFYLKDKSQIKCNFQKIHLPYINKGCFVWIPGLKKIAESFDLVCFVPDMHVLSYCLLPFGCHKYKTVTWSIGFRCSYKHPYIPNRKHCLADEIFQFLLSKCDANIFYMEKSKEFWKNTSLKMKNIFVAPNTTNVKNIKCNVMKKNTFLFVGTLYKGKGLDLLLDSYKNAIRNKLNVPILKIVGDGEMRKDLENYINEYELSNYVKLEGAIFDEEKLAPYFAEALLCISPSQAGLSVPKSMGYGVPFVTKRDAITGGEIFHIHNGEDGYLYDSDDQLTMIMKDAIDNPQKYVDMGIKAKIYYENNASINHMAEGAIQAFEYSLNK